MNNEKQPESGESILDRTTFGFFSPKKFDEEVGRMLESSPFRENRELAKHLLAPKDTNTTV